MIFIKEDVEKKKKEIFLEDNLDMLINDLDCYCEVCDKVNRILGIVVFVMD